MDKVLVNVYVPIINDSFDMYLPLQVQLSEVIPLIQKAVSELSEGRFFANTGNTLCRRDNGEILDINKSALELPLYHGSKLMLI